MKSKEPALRIGQAAARLGVSPHHLRQVCKSGLAEAEQSPGGQWRIPLTSIERMEREGVPAIPTFIEDDELDVPAPNPGKHLLAEPSPEMIEAVEEAEIEEAAVRKEEAAVRKKENTVRKLRLEYEEQQARDRLAERAQQEQARIVAEQAAARELEEVARHQIWVEEWADRTLRRIPHDVPGHLRLALHNALLSRLADLPRTQPNPLTQRLVDAEIDKALAPWTHQRTVDAAIEAVCAQLPYQMRYSPQSAAWKARVMRAARNEIENLGRVPRSQMDAAGTAAAKPIVAEFEFAQLCEAVASALPAGLTRDEQIGARERVLEAFGEYPVGTSQRRLEETRNVVLVPFNQVLKKREHERICEDVLLYASFKLPWSLSSEESKSALNEMRVAVARLPIGTTQREMEQARDRVVERISKEKDTQKRIAGLIEDGVREVYPYVQKLVDGGRVELDPGETTYSVAEGFKTAVRNGLKEELEANDTSDEAKKLAQRIVRDELGM